MREKEQLTVVLPAELREFAAKQAEREDRSVSRYVRRLLAQEAARAASGERGMSIAAAGTFRTSK
jgi:hypothetical protein